eukprot:3664810-Rhodomonas_salina.1
MCARAHSAPAHVPVPLPLRGHGPWSRPGAPTVPRGPQTVPVCKGGAKRVPGLKRYQGQNGTWRKVAWRLRSHVLRISPRSMSSASPFSNGSVTPGHVT